MSYFGKIIIILVSSIVLQLGVYLYLDRTLFAPASSFQVTKVKNIQEKTDGNAYYSYNRQYMAVVEPTSIKVSRMPGKVIVRTVDLANNQSLNIFRWLEDRNLAIIAYSQDELKSNSTNVILRQLNPTTEGHELTETITKLPRYSKMTDVAYSTATNVIYMQVQVDNNPATFRIYRTDANHDLKRVYLNTSLIGRIGVLYDLDYLIFEDLKENAIIARNGDGSWRYISPEVGKYRLIGIDLKNKIYLGKLNSKGLVQTVLTVDVKGKMLQQRDLHTPQNISHIKIDGLI